MSVIFGIALVFFLVKFPTFRCAVFHPVAFPLCAVKDFIQYVKRKEYNFCRSGELVAFTGLFGKGKTLSAVHRVVSAYKHYDGKKVWCPRRKKIVTQRVKVISNVSLKIPYENFTSLEQLVLDAEQKQVYDDEHDTLTITLVLGDEFAVQMNSRQFRTNIDPLLLNTILTCRHYYIALYYTAQRFGHVDALLRQVTNYVAECDKLWRFQRLRFFDAWELENATNTQLIQPFASTCWFVRDEDYDAYDTLATVGNLKHEMQAGHMMSEKEIRELQMNTQQANMDGVAKPSRRWMRNRQRKQV